MTKNRIDLVQDAKLFKSPPLLAGRKTREKERLDVKKQLKTEAIKPAVSEWAATVLFEPKKVGKLHFSIGHRKLNTVTVKDTDWWKICLVYTDDVIVYSTTVEEHIRHVDEILKALKNAGATLKINKCHYFQHTIDYLCHTIKPGKLKIDRANTDLLCHAKPLTNKSNLCSFLGSCNVYRRFMKRLYVQSRTA